MPVIRPSSLIDNVDTPIWAISESASNWRPRSPLTSTGSRNAPSFSARRKRPGVEEGTWSEAGRGGPGGPPDPAAVADRDDVRGQQLDQRVDVAAGRRGQERVLHLALQGEVGRVSALAGL